MRQTTLNGYNYRIDIVDDRGYIIREYAHIPKEITAHILNTLSHLMDHHRRYGILPNPQIDPILNLPEYIKRGEEYPDCFHPLDETFDINPRHNTPENSTPKLKPKPKWKGRKA